MILHHKLCFPFGQFSLLLVRQRFIHIAEDLVRRCNIDFNIAVFIFGNLFFYKCDRFFLRSAAAVSDTMENIGPVQIVFFVYL